MDTRGCAATTLGVLQGEMGSLGLSPQGPALVLQQVLPLPLPLLLLLTLLHVL
jgi:hypothetical protein